MAYTDDVHLRFPPAKKAEFDKLKARLARDIPKTWKEPTITDLGGTLLILARAANKTDLAAALETYRNEA